MRIEKKLVVFEQIAMKEVEEQRTQTAREIEESFKTAVDEAVRAAKRHAQERVRAERYNIDKMKNKEIVTASAEAKRALITLREKLTNELFDDITADLHAFVQSPAYEDYLITAIGRELLSPNAYAYVQVTPEDMRFAENIKAKTGLTAEPLNDRRMLGGFRLVTANRRAISDHTLQTRLQEVRRNFSMNNTELS